MHCMQSSQERGVSPQEHAQHVDCLAGAPLWSRSRATALQSCSTICASVQLSEDGCMQLARACSERHIEAMKPTWTLAVACRLQCEPVDAGCLLGQKPMRLTPSPSPTSPMTTPQVKQECGTPPHVRLHAALIAHDDLRARIRPAGTAQASAPGSNAPHLQGLVGTAHHVQPLPSALV